MYTNNIYSNISLLNIKHLNYIPLSAARRTSSKTPFKTSALLMVFCNFTHLQNLIYDFDNWPKSTGKIQNKYHS